jgi:hypothetical protein
MVAIRFILTVAETERMKYASRAEVSRIAIACRGFAPKVQARDKAIGCIRRTYNNPCNPKSASSMQIYIDSFLMGQRQRTCMD